MKIISLNGWAIFEIGVYCLIVCFFIAYIVGIVYCFVIQKNDPWSKNHKLLYWLLLPVMLLGPMYMIGSFILCIGCDLKCCNLLTRICWWADNLFSNYSDNVYALMNYIIIPGIALISLIASVMFCLPILIAISEKNAKKSCQGSVNEL